MSTGQWFREAEIAPLLRGPLIWSTWAWNHSSRRETRFLLGGTWTLLRHASPSPALCLCYYISYNFSRARSVTLGMATLDLFVCPATPVCTDMNFFTVSGGWILLVVFVTDIHGADRMNPDDSGEPLTIQSFHLLRRYLSIYSLYRRTVKDVIRREEQIIIPPLTHRSQITCFKTAEPWKHLPDVLLHWCERTAELPNIGLRKT